MIYICDFDGTLVDMKERYTTVYAHLVQELGGVPLNSDIYWEKKRNGTEENSLLEASGLHEDSFKKYFHERRNLLENTEMLELDYPLPGAQEFLDKTRNIEIHIVTNRRNLTHLMDELKRLKFTGYFSGVHAREKNMGGLNSKINAINRILDATNEKDAIIIGDSELDIQAGRKTGIRTVAVCSGMRNGEYLNKYFPDETVSGIDEYSSGMV